MSEYRRKMKELNSNEARDRWCLEVEQELGCSIEAEQGIPPGLL